MKVVVGITSCGRAPTLVFALMEGSIPLVLGLTVRMGMVVVMVVLVMWQDVVWVVSNVVLVLMVPMVICMVVCFKSHGHGWPAALSPHRRTARYILAQVVVRSRRPKSMTRDTCGRPVLRRLRLTIVLWHGPSRRVRGAPVALIVLPSTLFLVSTRFLVAHKGGNVAIVTRPASRTHGNIGLLWGDIVRRRCIHVGKIVPSSLGRWGLPLEVATFVLVAALIVMAVGR